MHKLIRVYKCFYFCFVVFLFYFFGFGTAHPEQNEKKKLAVIMAKNAFSGVLYYLHFMLR